MSLKKPKSPAKPAKKPKKFKPTKSTSQLLKEQRARAGGVAANPHNKPKSGKLADYKRKSATQRKTDKILHENAQRAVKRQAAAKKKTAKKKPGEK